MLERGEVIPDFVGRISGRDKENSMEPKALCRSLRCAQVAGVDGIESSAK